MIERRKACKIVAQNCRAPAPRGVGRRPSGLARSAGLLSCGGGRRFGRDLTVNRATNSSTTSLSGAVNFAGSGGAGEAPVRPSTPWTMSVNCLIARRSADADLLLDN
jgi:hypothetical protein